jgi:hypothetical protein
LPSNGSLLLDEFMLKTCFVGPFEQAGTYRRDVFTGRQLLEFVAFRQKTSASGLRTKILRSSSLVSSTALPVTSILRIDPEAFHVKPVAVSGIALPKMVKVSFPK